MLYGQPQKPITEEFHQLSLTQKQHSESVRSQYNEKYHQIMGNITPFPETIKDLISQLSARQKISFNSVYFFQDIQAKVFEHMQNYEIAVLQIYYGYFRFFVTVYSHDKQSYAHHLPSKESRQESTIYFPDTMEEKMVIKCYHIRNTEKKAQTFATALKEFCLFKIASGLGVGPKIIKHGGFDIVFSQSCVQFGIERCLQLSSAPSQQFMSLKECLIKKLMILHQFQFIHLDIKPSNIMLSSKQSEAVYIDFGFSKLIKQKQKFKSQSSFQGSMNYCGPEMKAIVSLEESFHWIDLYYNDAHCLKEALQQIKLSLQQYKSKIVGISFSQIQQIFYDSMLINSRKRTEFQEQQKIRNLKMLIYNQYQSILSKAEHINILKKHGQLILRFLMNFPYSELINKIFLFLIKNIERKDLSQFFRRMEFKKEKLLKGFQRSKIQSLNMISQNKLVKNLGLEFSLSSYVIRYESYKMVLIIKQGINKKLIDFSQIKKLSRNQYYKLVAKVVDLRSSQATFQEKIQLCKKFKEMIQVKSKLQIVSQQPELQQFFKLLLNFYMNSLSDGFEKIVPLAVVNLVIMEAISMDEILNIVSKAGRLVCAPLKSALLLFRLHLFHFWILLKVHSKYTRKMLNNTLEKISAALQDLIINNTEEFKAIQILSYFIKHSLHRSNMQDDYFESIIDYIKSDTKLDDQDKQQLLAFAIYKFYKQGGGQQYQKIFKISIFVHQYCNIDFGNIEKLDFIHLWMMKIFFKKQDKKQQQLTNLQKIIKCLKQTDLIKQFYFYYNSLVESFYNIDQNQDNLNQFCLDINYLIEIFKKDQQKSISIIISVIYSILRKTIWLKNQTQKIKIINMLKTFANNQILNMFLDSQQQNTFTIFYSNISYLCNIFFMLYKSEDPQILNFKQFYKIIKEKYNYYTECKHCMIAYSQIMDSVQLTLSVIDGQLERGILICLRNIKQSLNNNIITQGECGQLNQYISKMVKMISQLPNIQKQKKYSEQAFQIIDSNNLYKYVFNEQYGRQIYMFISFYTLFMAKNSLKFIKFQIQLTKLIKEHPFSQHVVIYNTGLSAITHQQYRFISFRPNQMLSLPANLPIIKHSTLQNPYFCLFISFLLRFSLQSTIIKQLMVLICKKVDFVSLQVRVITMQNMMQFLYKNNLFISSSRSKRRKIIDFASYINKLGTFKGFSRRLNLPAKLFNNICKSKLMKKRKIFYQKCQSQPK